jgi:hypothetical protein
MTNISDTNIGETGGLTIEHVERAAAFNKRVNANVAKIRDASKQLQRCANRKLYAYDEQDVATILAEARNAIDELEAAFRRASEAPARNAPWDLSIAKRARQAQQTDGR